MSQRLRSKAPAAISASEQLAPSELASSSGSESDEVVSMDPLSPATPASPLTPWTPFTPSTPRTPGWGVDGLSTPAVAAALERRVREFRRKLAARRAKVTLMQSPVRTLVLALQAGQEWVQTLAKWFWHHEFLGIVSVLLLLGYVAAYYVDGAHREYVRATEQWVEFVAWWVGLGVASSVGLGTGLHTFVLYLGPHIAKVSMAAHECKHLDFPLDGDDAFICEAASDASQPPTLLGIYQRVAFASFLWGLGTAIGELPPYFVARAARLAGKKLAEVDELGIGDDDDEDSDGEGSGSGSDAEDENKGVEHHARAFMDKVKHWMFKQLQRYGFWGIVVCASIPNPLFDLAGITCGHFLIPFWTFFTATFIGKAINKVTLQALFVIMMFKGDLVDWLISHLESVVPALHGFLGKQLAAARQTYHRAAGSHTAPPPSLFSYAWNTLLFVMVGGFLVSIVNSVAQERQAVLDEKKVEHFQDKHSARSRFRLLA